VAFAVLPGSGPLLCKLPGSFVSRLPITLASSCPTEQTPRRELNWVAPSSRYTHPAQRSLSGQIPLVRRDHKPFIFRRATFSSPPLRHFFPRSPIVIFPPPRFFLYDKARVLLALEKIGFPDPFFFPGIGDKGAICSSLTGWKTIQKKTPHFHISPNCIHSLPLLEGL